jgi:hypothetical protein
VTLRVATYLAPINEPLYRFLAAEMARTADVDIEFVIGRSYEDLATGAVDGAFVCGLPYVEMSDRLVALAAPVLDGARGPVVRRSQGCPVGLQRAAVAVRNGRGPPAPGPDG